MSELSCMETIPCIKQGDAYDLRVELALNGKGGAKGVDAVLQQTAKARSFDAVSALTDEELEARLSRLAREIEEAVGSGKKKGEKSADKP